MTIADMILGRSNQRRKLLTLFFTNEDREYYLRELERITNIPVGNIRRELNKLREDRLFVTRKRGNLLFYRLNKKHPFFRELKRILTPAIGAEGAIRDVLNRVSGIEVAFLFGSFAAGKARSDSDIDLMIIGKPDKALLTDSIASLENQLQREINYHTYTKGVFGRKKATKNSFLLQVLKGPKVFLIGDKDDL